MSLLLQLRAAAQKRAAYRRTLRELRSLPPYLADDLGLRPSEIERMAEEVVYG